MPVATETEVRSIPLTAKPAPRTSRTAWLLFVVLVMAQCAWILSLPVFPSQDGPVHVYYAKVTRDLLQHHATYAQDFRIGRPLPPYSVHAYLLVALTGIVSGETAEKLIACITVIVCAFGLAYLSRQIGRSAAWGCALASPFLLNRFLFLGFYGYLMGVGLALLTIGFWLRRRTVADRIGFFFLALLTLLAHPVPFLIVIAFCWSEALSGWRNAGCKDAITGVICRPTRNDVIALCSASALFLYIKAFSHSGTLWNYELLADAQQKLMRIIDVFHTWDELPLMVSSFNNAAAIALVIATVIAGWVALRESRSRKITRSQLVVGWAFLILVGLPFLPHTINGSGFFVERFSIWPPLLLFAGMAAADLPRKTGMFIGVIGVLITLLCTGVLDSYVRPVAREIDTRSIPAGRMKGERMMSINNSSRRGELMFNPYDFAATRFIDRGGAILVDAPWMYLEIMILDDIGPHMRVDQNRGPQVMEGPQAKVGIVAAHCGPTPGSSLVGNIAQRDSSEWRMAQYGCIQVLEPR